MEPQSLQALTDLVATACNLSVFEWVKLLSLVFVVGKILLVIEEIVLQHGWKTPSWAIRKLLRQLMQWALELPLVHGSVDQQVSKAISGVESSLIERGSQYPDHPQLPVSGLSPRQVLSDISKLQHMKRSAWEDGRLSGAVYHGGPELLDLQTKVYGLTTVANQLHPDCFPDVRRMEAEVVSMVLGLYNGPSGSCGSTTSGGTESLLLTALAAREWAKLHGRLPVGAVPEIIAPITVHAGIDKAAYYFGMRLLHAPLDPVTYKVDVGAVQRLIGPATVLIVGSAPNFPHGIIDDIEALGEIALSHNLPLHVDACLGSFVVPFLNELGRKVGKFDFRVPGVTSISCDTHKYGFAPKGSSIIMYRTPELRRCQYFVSSDWSGGLYASPTLAGSRPGALMAGCWATLLTIGRDGYLESARSIIDAAARIRQAIESLPRLASLKVIGDPQGAVISFTSTDINIYDLSDRLSKRGWHLSALQNPAAIHVACTRLTIPVVDELIAALESETQELIKLGSTKSDDGTRALYGVAGSVSTAGVAERLAAGFVDTLYKL